MNDYLRATTGQPFTAKDFRTWAGTVLASVALKEFEGFKSEREAKRNVVQAIAIVAERLGNTPAVCRKCYIHPAVLECYMRGELLQCTGKISLNGSEEPDHGLEQEEVELMRLL